MRSQPPWGEPPPHPAAVAWVPHALSLCSLTCGFLSVLLSARGDYAQAAAFIIAALFFDGFDGAAARVLHCEGPFGEMLDSLADLVAFGVAPAFLAYQANLHLFDPAGAFVAAFFAGCGAVRLARFPLVKRPRYFVGLPIPMAGAFLAMLGVHASLLPPELVPAATIAVSLLMVSTIHFPNFATALGVLPPPARWLLCLAVAPLLFMTARWTILVLLLIYVLLGPAGELRVALDRPHHGR